VAEPTETRDRGPSMVQLVRMRGEILAAAARHGATNVRVFGSVARGDAGTASDVDFLVDFEPGRSLLDLAGLLVDLEDLLGIPVDVVTEPGLKARIRQRVLAEAVPV
jgi:predicted nucleotidyltransferase